MAENVHDYAKTDMNSDEFMLYGGGIPCTLDTPCKSPTANNGKLSVRMLLFLSQLGALSQLINTRSDSLENMIGENTRAITSMKEVINENTKQITSVKEGYRIFEC